MPLLSERELTQRIKSKAIDGLYLLYGHDYGTVERFTHRLIRTLIPKEAEDLNLHKISGKELDLSELSDITEAYPMLCDRSVTVINDPPIKEMKKDDLQYFKQILKNIDGNTATVIIYITGIDVYKSKTTLLTEWAAFSKFCQKSGSVCAFEPKTAAALSKAAIAALSKAGLSISPSNAAYLAEICLLNTVTLQNELNKLRFLKKVGEITREDIDRTCVSLVDTDSFKLANEIVSKNADKAYKLLGELCRRPDEYIATLSSVNMAFVDLYRAKLARGIGATEQNIIDDFSYPVKLVFRAKNAYRMCKAHSLDDIRRCLFILSKADIDLKSKRVDPKIIFETAIAKICRGLS